MKVSDQMRSSLHNELYVAKRDTSREGYVTTHKGVVRVSVGFKHCENSYFSAVVCWMCREGFSEQIYLVGDTLQRYNLMALRGFDAQRAYEHSLEDGNAWIERHQPILRLFEDETGSQLNIVRWDELLHDPDFPKYRDDALSLYLGNEGFRDSVNKDIFRFAKNKSNAAELFDDKNFMENSRDFLLEETAVHELMLANHGGSQIYPGSQLNSQKYISLMGDDSIFPMLQTKYYVGLTFDRVKKTAADQTKAAA